MEVNAQKIKSLRSAKGWTQQHLADSCNLSLRTIQRVERYGNASHETVMSLASVFDTEVRGLLREEEVVVVQKVYIDLSEVPQYKLLLAALLLGAGFGALAMWLTMALTLG